MASAVTVVFGANSTQFQAELARMQTMTMAASKRMSMQAMGGHIQGMSTLVREGITIPREFLEGRGMGRIIASMSIFASALGLAASSSHKAATYSEQLAAGYERLAQKARLAEIAAIKKAEATAADAYAQNLEDEATIRAAEADALKAKSATEARIAAEEKAASALEAANAEEMEAVAAGEATAASVPMLAIFIGIVATLALLYGAYKIISGVMNTFTQREIDAAELALKLKLSYEEEANVLLKLADAAEKADDALRKMNQGHDDYAKRVDDAVESQKKLYEHTKKLAELKKEGQLTQVDIEEKQGAITHEDAVKKKAAIEKQAIDDAAAARKDELWQEREILGISANRAEAWKKQKQAEAQAAQDKIDKDPEGVANAKELARLEKVEKEARKKADAAEEDAAKLKPGRQKNLKLSEASTQNLIAEGAAFDIKSLKEKMKPEQVAAANAFEAAREATENAKNINEKHNKAVKDYADDSKNSPAEVAAEKASIDLKTKEEITPKLDAKGYSINSQQRVGAYSATAPILLQQLRALQSIDHKVTPMSPPRNHPPGAKSPQLSPAPTKHFDPINKYWR
jgi:hypothetical protein